MPVILQENLRGLLYTPYYAALTLDAYRQEGVAVELVTSPAPAQATVGLFAGTVDVAWGGPMRVMHMYEARSDSDLVCFGEAVTRDPFLLVGRDPRPDFVFGDLYGKRVATVRRGPHTLALPAGGSAPRGPRSRRAATRRRSDDGREHSGIAAR